MLAQSQSQSQSRSRSRIARALAPAALLGAACLLLATSPARAGTVMDFEDVTDRTWGEVIERGHGLVCDNLWVIDTGYVGVEGTGYEGAAVSAEYVAFNALGEDASISVASGPNLNIESAWIGSAWREGLTVTLEGFRDGELVASLTLSDLMPGEAEFVEIGFEDVDSVVFSSFGGVMNPDIGLWGGPQFVLEDFAFSVIPLPPALGAGLGLLACLGAARVGRRALERARA